MKVGMVGTGETSFAVVARHMFDKGYLILPFDMNPPPRAEGGLASAALPHFCGVPFHARACVRIAPENAYPLRGEALSMFSASIRFIHSIATRK
jgi:hypothetical protein